MGPPWTTGDGGTLHSCVHLQWHISFVRVWSVTTVELESGGRRSWHSLFIDNNYSMGQIPQNNTVTLTWFCWSLFYFQRKKQLSRLGPPVPSNHRDRFHDRKNLELWCGENHTQGQVYSSVSMSVVKERSSVLPTFSLHLPFLEGNFLYWSFNLYSDDECRVTSLRSVHWCELILPRLLT